MAVNQRSAELYLQRAHARIIVEFDLSPAEAANNAPAMALCKFTEFVVRYVPKNPQLRRLGDDILGAYRKSLPDLGGESWQIVVHLFRSSD
jgi:hypothetical protein